MKKYDVFKNNCLIFTGEENEARKVYYKLVKENGYTNQILKIIKHIENRDFIPIYNFNDIKDFFDLNNKCIVRDNIELKSIVNSSPENANLTFLDISYVTSLPIIKHKMILRWDTSNITDFRGSFSYYNYESYEYTPYQYDLDWMYIKKGAIISEMFKYTKFNKKLPKMETKISFNQFVKRTGLIVTPELLENNDMSVDKWCKNKHNQKLMKNNKQYNPILEYWINSDFITAEERINAMQVSGIEIFVI